jgi:hypothetical protein
MDYREKKNKVLKQEITIKQNEKKIIDLQKEFNRLRGLLPVSLLSLIYFFSPFFSFLILMSSFFSSTFFSLSSHSRSH